MGDYMGLRGQTLATVRVLLIVLPAFLLFGYNQSSLGGVLAFSSFTKSFPRIDTETTTGSLKAENARIQGRNSTDSDCSSYSELILRIRNRGGNLHYRMSDRTPGHYADW